MKRTDTVTAAKAMEMVHTYGTLLLVLVAKYETRPTLEALQAWLDTLPRPDRELLNEYAKLRSAMAAEAS